MKKFILIFLYFDIVLGFSIAVTETKYSEPQIANLVRIEKKADGNWKGLYQRKDGTKYYYWNASIYKGYPDTYSNPKDYAELGEKLLAMILINLLGVLFFLFIILFISV